MQTKRYTMVHCSFCHKHKSQVKKIIASNSAFICNECISLCNSMIVRENNSAQLSLIESVRITPRDIYNHLNEYVIGQQHAKKILSVAVYNHYKRILDGKNKDNDVEIEKSNIMMIGSTGCGKTLMASTLAKTLNVPFAIADATSLTEAGYVGDDVESVLLKLYQAADQDIQKAEMGIIYIDEIDKISKRSSSSSSGRDVSGEGVQQSLLKLVEGTVATVPQNGGRKSSNQETIKIDTSNILFICGGAFDGLDNIIKHRTEEKALGFGATIVDKSKTKSDEVISKVVTEDLIRYGMIPEFLGRFPIVTTLEDMDKASLIRVLTEPRNSLTKQYAQLFSIDGIKFDISESAISEIAQRAMDNKTGARGLRKIMESILLDIMFEECNKDTNVKKVCLDSDTDNVITVLKYNASGQLIDEGTNDDESVEDNSSRKFGG